MMDPLKARAFLLRAGIDPDGYGNKVDESIEQFTARLRGAGDETDPLWFVPVQDLVKEAL